MKIYGKNVALEALKENKKVHKIYLSNKFKDEEILSLIERKNINTKLLDNRELDKMCKGLHQGIILEVEDIKTYSFDEIIPNITTEYPLIVILDHLEDPHNLGGFNMYNDYELLYLAQENNEDAVNELRKKYNSLLYAKALSYSRSSHIDIKELLNETELAFYKAIDNYIDKNTFNTYLNYWLDIW
jgi:hypothetical protein